jgi:hypothetical protein
MESEVMKSETPIGQVRKWKMAWVRVLLVGVGCQSIVYLQESVYLPETRQIIKMQAQKSKGETSEA